MMAFGKRARIEIDKSIGIIILVVTLLIVISGVAYFGGDSITRAFNNFFPDYDAPEGDQVMEGWDDEEIGDVCGLQVGRVDGRDISTWYDYGSNSRNRIYMCDVFNSEMDIGDELSKEAVVGENNIDTLKNNEASSLEFSVDGYGNLRQGENKYYNIKFRENSEIFGTSSVHGSINYRKKTDDYIVAIEGVTGQLERDVEKILLSNNTIIPKNRMEYDVLSGKTFAKINLYNIGQRGWRNLWTTSDSYFIYYDGSWFWSPDKASWTKTPKTEVEGSSYNGETIESSSIKIVENLGDVGEAAGKKIMKDNSKKFNFLMEYIDVSRLIRVVISREEFFEKVDECPTGLGQTNLYVEWEKQGVGYIFLDRSWGDLRVGDVKENKFYLNNRFKGSLNNVDYEDRVLLPSEQALSFLDGTKIFSNNRICRYKE